MPTAIEGLRAGDVALGALLFVVTLGVTLAVGVLVLLRLPPSYFTAEAADGGFWASRPGWQQVALRIGKNLLGAALVAAGIVLSVPGVPGQGLLTLLIGVILLDLPGKRRFEQRLAAAPAILRALNRLRARFGKPPFAGPAQPAGPS